jgi:hypothetical protein
MNDETAQSWNVSSRLTTESLSLQALNMASWLTQGNPTGLIHYADHGSQYLSLTYANRCPHKKLETKLRAIQGDSSNQDPKKYKHDSRQAISMSRDLTVRCFTTYLSHVPRHPYHLDESTLTAFWPCQSIGWSLKQFSQASPKGRWPGSTGFRNLESHSS